MRDLSKRGVEAFVIPKDFTVRETAQHMFEKNVTLAVCVDDEQHVIGIFTEGDFRKAVFSGVGLDDRVINYLNTEYCFVEKGYTQDELVKIASEKIIHYILVLENKKLISLLSTEEIVTHKPLNLPKLNAKVVIMAGGQGKRLDPFTRILPKPLLPLGKEPVIKVIMDEFGKYGLTDFFISINDKRKMIKGYFHEHDLPYNINFIEESQPLGTAGALQFLAEEIDCPLLVSNCDNLIKINLNDLMSFHKNNKNLLTMVSAVHRHTVPYGVCEADVMGNLSKLQEKPHMDFLINTGLYLLDPAVPALLPKDTYYDMPTLITDLQNDNMKVGVYPIPENSWMDVGQWAEYDEAIKKLDLSLA